MSSMSVTTKGSEMAKNELPLILSSVQALTNVSTEQENRSIPSDGSCLIQRLKFNLEAYRELPNSLISRKDTSRFKSISEMINLPSSDSLLVYIDFTQECLSLLSLLDKALVHLSKDKEDAAKEKLFPSPKVLLSVSEIKSIHGLLQFTVSLGIYPYLSVEVDKLLRLKLSNAKSLEKFDQLSSKVKSLLLYKSLSVLVNLLSNPALGAIVSSKYLADILAALIQICYAPNPCEYATGVTSTVSISSPSNIEPKSLYNDGDVNEISAIQCEWCAEALHKIVQQSYQPLVIKELFALQSLSSPNKNKAHKSSSNNWVKRACGQLLSERLMARNGVNNVLKGILDSGEDNWKKCHAVAMVIATCPAQALSIDEYYSLICPQVLNLLTSTKESAIGQFFNVGVLTLSVMLTKQTNLARKYLVEPLMEPLSSCSESALFEGSLASVFGILHKVTCTLEPSSPLFAELLSYCPLFFYAWLAGNRSESFQSKEILCHVLRNSSSSEVLGFLCFICGFQSCPAENYHSLFEQHYNMNIAFEYLSENSSELLKIRTLSDAEALTKMNTEEMEKVGSSLLALLNVELNEIKIIGRFFVTCLQYLSSIILPQTKQMSFLGVTSKRVSRSDQQKGNLCSSPDTNSALLDCEVVLPPSHTEAYFNSLVLFVTASICENINSTLFQEVNLFDLLASIKSLVECHATYCKNHEIKDCLKVTANENREILGGSITLSIVFGLLSAVLNGAVEVSKEHRILIAELQPSLEIISSDYQNEELCSMAYELHICIATLGAVWSSDVKQKADAQVCKAKKILKENISSQCGVTKKVVGTESLTVSEEMCELAANTTSSIASDNTDRLSPYLMAIRDANDPLIPVKGHGVITLTKLIDKRDQETLMHAHNLISLFIKFLHNSDSYIYLSAINGLVSLSCVPSVRESVICSLCQAYAQLSTSSVPTQDTAGKLDTGRFTANIALAPKEDTSTQFVSDGARLCKTSNLGKLDVEARMKIGEALLKVSQLCGDFLPHYLDLFTAAIFLNTKDPEPLIRASSLSNLADLCASSQLSFYKIQVEVFSCVSSILRTEREVKVLQAALLVLKFIIKNLSKDTVESLSEELLEVYRILKSTESREKDELTRIHAQAALGELDIVMRHYIFPTTSTKLTKKISVLDI